MSKLKVLTNISPGGKECMCLYDNPNCQFGYNNQCDIEYVSTSKYNNLKECFSNKHREHSKEDIY